LGDAAFVERLRAESGLKERISAPEPVEGIVARFAAKFEVSPQAVASRSRLPRLLDARAAVCHVAVEAGHSGAEIARCLRVTRSGVFTAKKRGEKLLETISGI
jgi:DNA-binding CsgD family transcriptional regulator